MKKKLLTGPRVIGILVLLALAGAIFVAMRRPAIEVETGRVSRGPMTVSVTDLGETRVTNLFVVSAPVTGRLTRVPLKPGDPVTAMATVLGHITPVEPGPLDARTEAQIQANILTLEAQLGAARSRLLELAAARNLAESEYDRTAALAPRGFVSRANLDRARATRDRTRAAHAEGRQSIDAARHAVEAARAALTVSGQRERGRGAITVTSPVGGFVLRVPQESERVVTAGMPLVEIGDPERLEVVVDLLTADAVRVRPGAAVSIEDWGGVRPLQGRVRRVEPFGFTKISALGVEEQRVNVIIDLIEPRARWTRLGHGFRVTVAIAVWQMRDGLLVPVSALFRDGGRWTVFVLGGDGRAEARRVEIGQLNDDVAEVRAGLRQNEAVILHPGDRVAAGVRVRPRG